MGAINIAIREIDHGFSKLMADLQTLGKGVDVKVGVLDDGKGAETHTGGLSNAELAAVHEFGTLDGRIPERSFIRSTFDRFRSRYRDMFGQILKAWLAGTLDLDKGLNGLGLRAATDIKTTVMSGDGVPPPNAPETIRRKAEKGGAFRAAVRRRDKLAGFIGPRTLEQTTKAANRLDDAVMGVASAYQASAAGVRTLVDTGRLVGSISWAIMRGGK